MEHDYKCDYVEPFIHVYEDGDFVASYEIKGHFKKSLKLFKLERLVQDIGYTKKYAEIYFNAIKDLI